MTRKLPALIEALRAPGVLSPGDETDLIETHASWLLLAGDFAWKIKKPVDFGFVDFSTLERRRRFCEEELRINRRFNPWLYEAVVPIRGDETAPRFDGDGPVIEYAVRMRRFQREDEFAELARNGVLEGEAIEALAATVAAFHSEADNRPSDPSWGSPDLVLEHCLGNFESLSEAPLLAEDRERLRRLERWTRDEHARLRALIGARRAAGFVRECHGDLHLRNIVMIDGRPTPFDALEFDPALRWIDVVTEIAFTMMDLEHHRRHDLARRFLDAWLERTGDFEGLALLPLMLAYRALVRAKVAALDAMTRPDGADREQLMGVVHDYLGLADGFAAPRPRALAITCGVSGSGKSRLALQLAQAGEWVRIRSDVERKRMAGLAAAERATTAPETGLYSEPRTDATYDRLAELAGAVLRAGFPALVDATFLNRRHRTQLRALARDCGAGFCILAIDAPEAVLRERVTRRIEAASDPSDADLAVLEHQLRSREPLDSEERAYALAVDSSSELDARGIEWELRARCAALQADAPAQPPA